MYADEYEDQLPYNTPGKNWNDYRTNWVDGVMSYETEPFFDHTQSTNAELLVASRYSQLGPYVKSYGVYKCPSDKSWIELGGHRYPRVRS